MQSSVVRSSDTLGSCYSSGEREQPTLDEMNVFVDNTQPAVVVKVYHMITLLLVLRKSISSARLVQSTRLRVGQQRYGYAFAQIEQQANSERSVSEIASSRSRGC